MSADPHDASNLATAAKNCQPLSQPQFNIAGKYVLITGASQGIGYGIAQSCVDADAAGVMITALPGDNCEQSAQRLAKRRNTCQVEFFEMDASKEEDCQACMEKAQKCFNGKLDGLVNSAGITRRASMSQTTTEVFRQIMDINVLGPILMIKLATQIMIDAGQGGSIVNISSINANNGDAGKSIYAISKGALNAATNLAAVEYKEHHIRVNGINVGLTLTEGELQTQDDPKWLEENDAKRSKFGRMLRPVDIAATVGFLLSDASVMITGTTIDQHPENVLGTKG